MVDTLIVREGTAHKVIITITTDHAGVKDMAINILNLKEVPTGGILAEVCGEADHMQNKPMVEVKSAIKRITIHLDWGHPSYKG